MSAQNAERMWARVTGRVQGVGFRASVCDRARRLNLRGWVRNTRDGAVELEAEGPRPDLESLRAFLARGPALAVVRGVETRELPAVGETGGFEVRWR